jgi:LSD1 subclass zinc finger protein
MADTATCPTCNVELRLPSGVKTVRCPQCKTTLKIEGPPAPLPFVKPAKPAAPAKPAPPPVVVKAKKPKAEIVDEAAEAEEESSKAKSEKKKRVREEIEKIEDEKEEEKERRIEMKEYCRKGRNSLGLLYWGIRLYLVGFLLTLIMLIVLRIVPPLAAILLPICGLVSLASLILLGIGFVITGFGPPSSRHLGWIGLGCVVLQAGMILVQLFIETIRFIIIIRRMAENPEGLVLKGYLDESYLMDYALIGLNTNLFALSDAPARFVTRCGVPWFGFIAGALEFTRMVVLGLLVQIYAEQGKAPETGFKAFRVVSVFFWTMLLTMMFRLALSLFMDGVQPQPGDFLFYMGNIMQLVFFLIGLIVYTLQSLKLSDIIEDTKEVVVADRYLAKSAPMEL